jgi:hypothetical protein
MQPRRLFSDSARREQVCLYITRGSRAPVFMATVTVTVTRTSSSAPWGIILGEAPLGLVILRCVPGSPAAQSSVPCGLVVGLGSRRPPVPATVSDFRSATASLTTLTLKVFSSAPKLAPVQERKYRPRRGPGAKPNQTKLNQTKIRPPAPRRCTVCRAGTLQA